jgi:hypothetical protein
VPREFAKSKKETTKRVITRKLDLLQLFPLQIIKYSRLSRVNLSSLRFLATVKNIQFDMQVLSFLGELYSIHCLQSLLFVGQRFKVRKEINKSFILETGTLSINLSHLLNEQQCKMLSKSLYL